MTRGLLLLGALTCALSLSSCAPHAPTAEPLKVTPRSQLTPKNPAFKPSLAGIDWQRDTYSTSGKKLLNAGYAALAATRNKRVSLFVGKTLGYDSLVRVQYLPSGLIAKMEVHFTGTDLLWNRYAGIRDTLLRTYGPGLPVGEPKFAPNNSTLTNLYRARRAPGTYWTFTRSGYTAALLIDRSPGADINEPLVVSLHLEPPDYAARTANRNVAPTVSTKTPPKTVLPKGMQ